MSDEKNVDKDVDEKTCASCSHVHKKADGTCDCGCDVGVVVETETAV